MKRLKRNISFLVVSVLVFCMLPAGHAVDNASVLLSIGHTDTDTVTLSGTTRSIVLTVPYGFSGTVDLNNGLSISYNESLYENVVVSPESAAGVGDTVRVTVSYNNISDDEGAESSSTVYYVTIAAAAAEAAEFSGTIRKSSVYPQAVSFTGTDFTDKYSQNDGDPIGFISITGSNLSVGTLKFSGSTYVFGTLIPVSQLASLSFSPNSSGTASYNVAAYSNTDSSASIGNVTLTITIKSVPSIQSAISKSVLVGSSCSFSLPEFTSSLSLNGGTLDSIEITPIATSYGTWYNGSAALTGSTLFSPSDIGSLSFRGSAAGTAAFQWRASNEVGFSNTGTGSITVSSASLTLSSYSASSSMVRGDTWTLSASHFSFSPSYASVSYVKIASIPSSSDGYLYLSTALAKNDTYGYPAISANKALTAGAVIPYDSLKYLRISTKSSGTGSSVSFTWTATIDTTIKTASWATAASYTVRFLTAGTVSYDTDLNVSVALKASDFSSAFSAESGYTLSYVTFTLPDANTGKLYYNYNLSSKTGTAASASTKYYGSTSPCLSDLTFVPYSGYTGTVTISYKAYTSSGIYMTGTLKIIVSNSAGGTVSYITDKNSAIAVDAADFSDSFKDATGETLSYVKFTLPSSSYGKLYYDYVSASSYDSAVSASKKYYIFSSPYLSYVTFVPHDNYTGTVSIAFTGYSSDGDSHKGKLQIQVIDSPAGIVSYSVSMNGPALLSGDDFANEFISVTGSVLSYVTFSVSKSTSGTLYLDYSEEKGTGTKVSASTKYYNGATPDLSDITFVPASGFSGTAVVDYLGYTASGTSYAGKLKITVGASTAGSVTLKTDAGTPLSLSSGDFAAKFYAGTGSSLSYIIFNLPSSSYGRLYYNYTSSSSYGSLVPKDTKYYVSSSPYLSSVSFVPASDYSGSFTVTFTGYTLAGKGYEGKLRITVGDDNSAGMVSYDTSINTKVTFDADDFCDVFESETGTELSYVKFSLPSYSYGKLYYSYTSASNYSSVVSSGTKYYASASPYLSKVTFVPYTDYLGIVTIGFKAYDDDGDIYPGTLVINVGGDESIAVSYETEMGTPLTFDSDDFQAAFKEQTDSSLSYVKFSLPSSSQGKLYLNYASSSSSGSSVSASTKYYRSSSPSLSKITFMPYAGYYGIVSIGFTAYDSGGDSYPGILYITVKRRSAGTVRLYAEKNTTTAFCSDDFGTAFLSETGSSLSYVTFELPSASSGSLYYGYRSASSYDSKVSAGTKYYVSSSPQLSNIAFVPSKGYTGTLSITYTGYTKSGSAYTGEMLIEVYDSLPFSDVKGNYSWAGDAIEYLYQSGVVTGTDSTTFSPQRGVKRGDFILMIHRAFQFTSSSSGNFADVSSKSYYYDAVTSAKALGIAVGSGGKFYPESEISREDAMVILVRALSASGKSLPSGDRSDLSGFSDRNSVSDYAIAAAAALVKANMITGSNGLLNPKKSITRAEMAVILHRVLTTFS